MATRVTQMLAQVLSDQDPSLRITQQVLQVLTDQDPSLRITQQAAQVLADNDPAFRLTQQAAQVLVDNDPSLRITQQAAQVLSDQSVSMRLTQQVAQVLYEPELFEYLPDSDTSKGTWTASTGSDLYAMIDADDANYIQSALSPSDLNDVFEVSYSTIDWYDVGYEFQIRIKFTKVDSSGTTVFLDDDTIDLTIELINNSVTLETWTVPAIRGESGEFRCYWDQTDAKPITTTAFSVRVTANTSTSGTAHRVRIYYLGIWSKDAPLEVTTTAVSASWSAVTPTTSINASVSPVSASWSVVAPTTTLSVSTTAVSASWSVVAPSTSLSITPTPLMATWATVAPSVTGVLTVNVSPVSANWSAVTPATTIATSVDPVSASWSVVAPTTDMDISVSPVSATWSVVTPTTSTVSGVTPLIATATWSVVVPITAISVSVDPLVLVWSVPAVTPDGGPDPDVPTEFERRRVPAGRMGSGVMKTIFPSKQVRTSLTERRATHLTSRVRRHIAKGFSETYFSAAYDDTVVNAVSQWDGTSDRVFNVLEYTFPDSLTPSATLGLCGPVFAGQQLVISLNNTFTQSLTLDTSLCLSAPSFVDGTTDYTQITLNADGENIHLIGLNEADTLKWFVVASNGAALS